MTVYLVGESFYDVALSYSLQDRNAHIVLLEDAVYCALSARGFRGETFALADDVSKRGLSSRVPATLHLISYDELVQMMEKEKVINFL